MTEELEKLKKGFRRQSEVEPGLQAKVEAIEAAMLAFEEAKIFNQTQGTRADARLKDSGETEKPLSKWRRLMMTLNTKWSYSLAGGASVAVLAMLLVRPDVIVLPDLPRIFEDDAGAFKSAGPVQQEAVTSEKMADIGKTVTVMSAPVTNPQVPGLAEQQSIRKTLRDEIAQAQPRSQLRYENKIGVPAKSVPEAVLPSYQDQGRDKFQSFNNNPVKLTRETPVSTFSADVDTASYAFTRASLNNNVLPQKDAVRVEELINYFNYDYEAPSDPSQPFKASVEIMPTPWNDGTKLMSIGIKGYELPKADQPPVNLVFLIDTSGSMNAPNKLPLLRNSFKLLLSSLKPEDRVSIVTYAGSAGTVLEPTEVKDENRILGALDRLSAGGSTAGGEGIRQAYALAQQAKIENGVNRVILATDGDFNVGITNPEELKSFVERKRKSGISLSVLGFGRGNYNDALMQTLAQNGNGNAAYIDGLPEARKVLVEEVGATLFTIAKDVKLQVEFNPAIVRDYRLIGYETRSLTHDQFNNDKVDAGEIGAGHTVTALYEFSTTGSQAGLIDPLRYSMIENKKAVSASDEFGFLKIRYKLPDQETSTLETRALTKDDAVLDPSSASTETRFAASVSAFGQLLRGGEHMGDFDYDDVISMANSAKGMDPFGYRSEFVGLVRAAKTASALEPQK